MFVLSLSSIKHESEPPFEPDLKRSFVLSGCLFNSHFCHLSWLIVFLCGVPNQGFATMACVCIPKTPVFLVCVPAQRINNHLKRLLERSLILSYDQQTRSCSPFEPEWPPRLSIALINDLCCFHFVPRFHLGCCRRFKRFCCAKCRGLSLNNKKRRHSHDQQGRRVLIHDRG